MGSVGARVIKAGTGTVVKDRLIYLSGIDEAEAVDQTVLATATAGPKLFTPEVLGYVGVLVAVLDDVFDQEGDGPSEVRSEDGHLCLVGAA